MVSVETNLMGDEALNQPLQGWCPVNWTGKNNSGLASKCTLYSDSQQPMAVSGG